MRKWKVRYHNGDNKTIGHVIIEADTMDHNIIRERARRKLLSMDTSYMPSSVELIREDNP